MTKNPKSSLWKFLKKCPNLWQTSKALCFLPGFQSIFWETNRFLESLFPFLTKVAIHNLENRTTVHLVTAELNPFSFSSFAEVHEVKHHEIRGSVTQILIRDSDAFTYVTIMALKCWISFLSFSSCLVHENSMLTHEISQDWKGTNTKSTKSCSCRDIPGR